MPGEQTMTQIWRLQSIIDIYRRGSYRSDLIGIAIDLEKMFDSLQWDILFEHLHFIGIAPQLVDLLEQTYRSVDVHFITNQGRSRKVAYNNGMLQGTAHGPLLAVIYYQVAIDYVKKTCNSGFKFKTNIFKILAYSDDVILLSKSRVEAQTQYNAFRRITAMLKLRINI